MKSLIYLIIITVVFSTNVFGQNIVPQKSCKMMTDREADELNGEVSKVIQESADLKFKFEKQVESEKRMSSVVEYDKQGNRLYRKAYSSGKLFVITKYANSDGDKVSIEENIPNDESPVFTVTNPEKEEKPKDARYSFKFKYEYDNNCNRIKEFWISNTGDIWIEDNIEFNENRKPVKEIRRHSGKDQISSIVFSKYNEKGYLLEEIYADENGLRAKYILQ